MRAGKNVADGGGKAGVEGMFDSIAGRYDLLNRLLSFGVDRYWRRHAVRQAGRYVRPAEVLDVATGTGDLALEVMRLGPVRVTGIDISDQMLEEGRRKVERRGYREMISLSRGDALATGFADSSFDLVMSAFGVRNFPDTLAGLTEMCRVARPGGVVMVLEFSRPRRFPFSQIYRLYFTRLLPLIGRRVSGDPDAYSYLPETVMQFPDDEKFMALMSAAGLTGIREKRLTGGIATIYTGIKEERLPAQ